MSTVFAKLGLRDYIRRHVYSVPADAADGLAIPPASTEMTATPPEAGPVWYFAYGSNLSDSTFLGRRKQQPLKTIQATAPGYILRFDLPGIPYQEPAFSSIRPRRNENDPDVIGIAYLLAHDEYERLLLSEGGRKGGYMELDVPVKPLMDLTSGTETIMCKSLGTRIPRENPHPQPSARYITLIRNGAAEHAFPSEYRKYLDSIPIYKVKSFKTEAGRVLFLLLWLPIVVLIFALMASTKNKNGEMPEWLRRFQRMTFSAMWSTHDKYFSRIFGRGDISPEESRAASDEKARLV